MLYVTAYCINWVDCSVCLITCMQELEEAQSTIEGLRTNLQQSEEKYNKIVKTVKVARSRIQALTTDKDKVCLCVHKTTFLV